MVWRVNVDNHDFRIKRSEIEDLQKICNELYSQNLAMKSELDLILRGMKTKNDLLESEIFRFQSQVRLLKEKIKQVRMQNKVVGAEQSQSYSSFRGVD